MMPVVPGVGGVVDPVPCGGAVPTEAHDGAGGLAGGGFPFFVEAVDAIDPRADRVDIATGVHGHVHGAWGFSLGLGRSDAEQQDEGGGWERVDGKLGHVRGMNADTEGSESAGWLVMMQGRNQ
jgi:hypothetical protein